MSNAAGDRLPAPDPPLRPVHRGRRRHPAGAAGRDDGPARSQRRRQDHGGAGADHADTRCSSGELSIFGLDARDHTMDIRCNIGYVPQQLSIESALTGRQNVALVRPVVRRAPHATIRTGGRGAGTPWSYSTSPTSWPAPTPAAWCRPPRSGTGTGQPPVAADPRRTDGGTGSRLRATVSGPTCEACRDNSA